MQDGQPATFQATQPDKHDWLHRSICYLYGSITLRDKQGSELHMVLNCFMPIPHASHPENCFHEQI